MGKNHCSCNGEWRKSGSACTQCEDWEFPLTTSCDGPHPRVDALVPSEPVFLFPNSRNPDMHRPCFMHQHHGLLTGMDTFFQRPRTWLTKCMYGACVSFIECFQFNCTFSWIQMSQFVANECLIIVCGVQIIFRLCV